MAESEQATDNEDSRSKTEMLKRAKITVMATILPGWQLNCLAVPDSVIFFNILIGGLIMLTVVCYV